VKNEKLQEQYARGNCLSEQSKQTADKFRARTAQAEREFAENNENKRLV